MHAVAKVDVRDASLLIHYLGALCASSSVRVAGAVRSASICLGLCDDSCCESAAYLCAEVFSKKLPSNGDDIFSLKKGGI